MIIKRIIAFSIFIGAQTYGMGFDSPDCKIVNGKFIAAEDLQFKRTKKILAQMGNVYVPDPVVVDTPLIPELVLNNFWRSLQNKSQEEKDAAFKKVYEMSFSYAGYALRRYHIAAAALIRANVNITNGRPTPLEEALDRQDVSLCTLLLENGAYPEWRMHQFIMFPIFKVTKEPLARVFFESRSENSY